MSRLPQISGRDLIRLLHSLGYETVRQLGSHVQATREEAESNMREAIEFHIDGLRKEGYPVPEPQTTSSYVDLPT
jgi:predicted RNA binding protein YcfA (HicA-like mRNA interferase family)